MLLARRAVLPDSGAMRTLSALLLFVGIAAAGSDTPPVGPPWKSDILTAQKEALERWKPVFFYFTKTY